MKVLWFSLSPCGSLRRNNTKRVIQGWMISLEDALKQNTEIELEVAYFSDKEEKAFTYDGVKYYPMYIKRGCGILAKIIETYRTTEAIDKQAKAVMLDVVKQSTPDLIHIHGTEQSFGLIAEEIKHIPICYSLQGLLAPISERFFAGYTETQINKYRGLYAKLRGTTATHDYRRISKKGEREIGFIKGAKYILGRTEWDHSICKMINPDARYFIINEILREPFYTTRWRKDEFGKPLQLLTVLSPGQIYKGYETLLKAASLLKKHYGNDFAWNVAGYSSNNWLADIGHKIYKTTDKECNINLCGLVSAEELATMLANTDIYVQTSHIENSPNSICEAMIVGTPVIATHVGGTETMLQGCGTLIPDGDPYIMAATIIKVAGDFDKAKQKSTKSIDIAMSRHNKNEIALQLKKTYNHIINEFNNL